MTACAAVCPKLMNALAKGTDNALEDICPDRKGTWGCAVREKECAEFVQMVREGKTAEETEQSQILDCTMFDFKCAEQKKKADTGDPTCFAAAMSWMEEGCEDAARKGTLATNKATCCPLKE